MTTHIGFTGTRQGCTQAQLQSLASLLVQLSDGDTVLHHGDCVGADETAHAVAYRLGARLVIHPPDNDKQRAFCDDKQHSATTLIMYARPYLQRNRDIVNACHVLVACPGETTDVPRGSGTWATIRYADRQGVPTHIIWPDGSIERRQS